MKVEGVIKIVRNIVLAYLIYVIIFGALIFLIKPKEKNISINTEEYFGDEVYVDRVSLVEGRYESYLARLYMIENARESIDMAYYTLHDGETTRVVLGSLIDAADRGVNVRILLDGMFHNLKGEIKDTIYAFENHPNIELKFYEDLKPLQPWTFNNRLHDKFIIVDGKEFILGGRNIGDKYFLENYDEDRQVRDRDVFVFKDDLERRSSIEDLEDYFEKLWNIEYSKNPVKRMSDRKIEKGNSLKELLLNSYRTEKKENKDLAKKPYCLKNNFKTNKVSIINNPLTRGNKYPLVFKTIVKLGNESNNLKIQSPYVLPTKLMNDFVKDYQLNYEDITLYTNSETSSPNLFAMAGYTKNRNTIVDTGLNVYEYQSPGSIHAKSYIYDERLTAVGSLNMDNRSAFLSTETMVIIDSVDFSEHLLKEFDKIESRSFKVGKDYEYISNGEDIKEASLIKKLTIRVLSVFTYFFDYML